LGTHAARGSCFQQGVMIGKDTANNTVAITTFVFSALFRL
jgi:hypothetical protein